MNQGATCYLNSLIQTLYMTPDFRKSIYELTPDDLGLQKVEVEEVVTVDNEKKQNLVGMGFDEKKAIASLIKFPNSNQEEERIEWILSCTDDEVEKLTSVKKNVVSKRKKGKGIPRELQALFSTLQATNQHGVSTFKLTKSFKWDNSVISQQHDVQELNRVLFEAINQSLKNTPRSELIEDLYTGERETQIICSKCQHVSSRNETFQDIPVPVSDYQTIYESFESLTTFENLTGDNQYYCEQCKAKVDAKLGSVYKKFPKILILCLNRFDFDLKTFNRIKNCKKFSFPLVLDMHPYTQEALLKNPNREKSQPSYHKNNDDIKENIVNDKKEKTDEDKKDKTDEDKKDEKGENKDEKEEEKKKMRKKNYMIYFLATLIVFLHIFTISLV